MGTQGSRHRVKFGGAVKEKQVTINQYQNIVSVPMKLKSAIASSQAVKNLYLKINKVCK